MIRGGNRYHDYWDDIHHRPGNRMGERDDDYYRRQQFRPGLDHGGLGPRGSNRYHDYRDDIHHRSGNCNGEGGVKPVAVPIMMSRRGVP